MAATDKYQGAHAEVHDPIENGFAVTPSDSADLSYVTRSVYIGGAGNLRVTLKGMATGTYVTYTGMLVGVSYPIRATRIWATGTTATNILGEY